MTAAERIGPAPSETGTPGYEDFGDNHPCFLTATLAGLLSFWKASGCGGRSLGELSAEENFLLSHISRKQSHQLKVRTGEQMLVGQGERSRSDVTV